LAKIPENGEAQEFSSEWNSNETLSLPAAVNVNLVLRNPRGEDIQFSTMVIIPVVN
jgi:hypothetical protein